MPVSAMRAILYKQYGGALKWVNKVKGMKDSQVMAIYYRMLRAGQLK